MNILYISSKKRWGGVVSWMIRTAEGLNKRGHNIYILSHPNSKLNISAKEYSINLFEKKLGPACNPFMIFYIASLIKNKKIDIVVTNIDKEVGIGGAAAKLCGIPNVRRVGSDKDFNNRLKVKWGHLIFVDSLIVPCDFISNLLTKQYTWLKREKFTTVYNGRNVSSFDKYAVSELKKKWEILPNEKIIGITSQLTKVKHIDDLIEVFSTISQTHKDWNLVITGEGPEKKHLENLARDLNLSSKIRFPGFMNNPTLAAACYDIAVLSSVREGFPNSIVEYMSVGTPVISTDVGGVNEIITDMYNGILIPFGDLDQMRDKIMLLIKEPELRTKLSNNAMTTVNEKFSEDIMIDKLESIFKEQVKC